MPNTLIKSNTPRIIEVAKVEGEVYLNVAEMFSHTIQGEGISIGAPATFLRLQNCTLDCVWCDSTEVWRSGSPYSVTELLDMMERSGVVTSFMNGHHLILTGGSPMLQQTKLVQLIFEFRKRFGFKPYIEIENEAVIQARPEFEFLVDQWNNSPKLSNSGMKLASRYKPEVLANLGKLSNSWFKFVIDSESDWLEIESNFIQPGLIRYDQIILMPKGQTREELYLTRELTVDLCIKYNVRFSDRLHVTVWDKKTGV